MGPGWIDGADVSQEWRNARGENAWVADDDKLGMHSRYGAGRVRVQLKPDGTPDFDRLTYTEAPAINAVAWGVDAEGIIRVALVIQARPFADNPDGTPAAPPIVFGQPAILGFLNKIVGGGFETAHQAGERETGEESRAAVVLSIKPMGHHISQPTFATSWGELLDIQVDLEQLTAELDRQEGIFAAEYLPLWELRQRIAAENVDGVNYRAAVPNATLFTWICLHPEAIPQLIGPPPKALAPEAV